MWTWTSTILFLILLGIIFYQEVILRNITEKKLSKSDKVVKKFLKEHGDPNDIDY